jgi:hypothetical protein
MQGEKEKQMDRDDALDAVDAGEERLRDEQIADERVAEHEEPLDTRRAKRGTPAGSSDGDYAPLFVDSQAEKFRIQWVEIQSRFVDDPRVAVKEADDLVAAVIKTITRTFSDERMTLEDQWKSGDKVSTEDLRVAMQRYRSFFNRLLTL